MAHDGTTPQLTPEAARMLTEATRALMAAGCVSPRQLAVILHAADIADTLADREYYAPGTTIDQLMEEAVETARDDVTDDIRDAATYLTI